MTVAARAHYHLVGVSGVGMSALAQALLGCGQRVSGSDRYRDMGLDLAVNRKLRRAGVEFVAQDGGGVTDATAAVVVSTAIEDDNPDVAAARRHSIPVRHRAEMLAALVGGSSCVAVAGTSGKSTVTGMVGWILEQLGRDPTVVNGAPLVNWDTDERLGNVRIGGSGTWVIEADESDRSLLRFHPEWALITNVSRDHFTLEETRELFRQFSRQVSNGLVSALEPHPAFGTFAPCVTAAGSTFSYAGWEFEVNVPGRHNAENALNAVLLCEKMGLELDGVASVLRGFRGIRRRLERIGQAGGVTVIDDYGHNAAKIRAAWETLGPHVDRVVCIWRPHGYGPLRAMLTELADMFADVCRPADRLLLLPVYDVGGTTDRTIDSGALVAALSARGTPAELVADYDECVGRVAQLTAGEGSSVVMTMGARDPGLPSLARRVLEALG